MAISHSIINMQQSVFLSEREDSLTLTAPLVEDSVSSPPLHVYRSMHSHHIPIHVWPSTNGKGRFKKNIYIDELIHCSSQTTCENTPSLLKLRHNFFSPSNLDSEGGDRGKRSKPPAQLTIQPFAPWGNLDARLRRGNTAKSARSCGK